MDLRNSELMDLRLKLLCNSETKTANDGASISIVEHASPEEVMKIKSLCHGSFSSGADPMSYRSYGSSIYQANDAKAYNSNLESIKEATLEQTLKRHFK